MKSSNHIHIKLIILILCYTLFCLTGHAQNHAQNKERLQRLNNISEISNEEREELLTYLKDQIKHDPFICDSIDLIQPIKTYEYLNTFYTDTKDNNLKRTISLLKFRCLIEINRSDLKNKVNTHYEIIERELFHELLETKFSHIQRAAIYIWASWKLVITNRILTNKDITQIYSMIYSAKNSLYHVSYPKAEVAVQLLSAILYIRIGLPLYALEELQHPLIEKAYSYRNWGEQFDLLFSTIHYILGDHEEAIKYSRNTRNFSTVHANLLLRERNYEQLYHYCHLPFKNSYKEKAAFLNSQFAINTYKAIAYYHSRGNDNEYKRLVEENHIIYQNLLSNGIKFTIPPHHIINRLKGENRGHKLQKNEIEQYINNSIFKNYFEFTDSKPSIKTNTLRQFTSSFIIHNILLWDQLTCIIEYYKNIETNKVSDHIHYANQLIKIQKDRINFSQRDQVGMFMNEIHERNAKSSTALQKANYELTVTQLLYILPLFVILAILISIFAYLKHYERTRIHNIYLFQKKIVESSKKKISKILTSESPVPISKYDRLRNYIIDNKIYLIRRPDINEIANQVDISINEISAIILKANNSTNFNDWINSIRLDIFIKEFDINTSILDNEIIKYGFTSRSSFYRFFKNTTNQTPHEFFKERSRKYSE